MKVAVSGSSTKFVHSWAKLKKVEQSIRKVEKIPTKIDIVEQSCTNLNKVGQVKLNNLWSVLLFWWYWNEPFVIKWISLARKYNWVIFVKGVFVTKWIALAR